MSRSYEDIEKIAKKKDWKVNTDKEYVNKIIDGLNHNKKTKGRFYCPCKIPTGNQIEDSKIICPCKYATNEISKNGICHCGLYMKGG